MQNGVGIVEKQNILRRLHRKLIRGEANPRVVANSIVLDRGVRSPESDATELNQSLISVRIEPASDQTRAQSLLRACAIETEVFTIGRKVGFVAQAPVEVDFCIRQVEPYTLSRRHCVIERAEDHITISDLGGKYGFLIDDQRVGGRPTAPKSIELKSGTYHLVLGPRGSSVCFDLIVG